MKKIAFAAIGLLAVLAAAVLIGPNFIDWNAYKGRIAAGVRDAIGRATAIDGDVSFVVLPAPALRVAGVRIANFDGARTPDMLRLKELRLRLSVGALLEGRIAVEQLELIEPVLALETGADGQASWDIESDAESSGAATGSGSGADGPIEISLAGVTVQNGSVSYRAAGQGTAETVDGLNMAISAPSLMGPFNITADARYRKTLFSVALKTGAVKPNQPIEFTLKLALIEAAASIEFTGRLTAPGPDALISGNVKLSGDSAARLASRGTDSPMPAVLRNPVTLEAALMASGQAVSLNDIRFKLGDTTGHGAVSITLGDVIGADIAVSVNRLDLDALLAETGVLAADRTGAAPPAAASPTAAAAPKAAFFLPPNLNLSLDLVIEAIKYRGGVIRQAGIRGALASGAVTLDRASALLPGGSGVSLVGFVQAVDGEPLFEGEIAAASDNLRGLLRWAGVDTRVLPADRMRGFSFSSQLTAKSSAVQITDINLRLDASTATGGLAVALRERLGFGLRLDIDRLNLDAYLPKPATGHRPADATKAAPAKQQSPPADAPLAFLGSFDANIEFKVGRLTVAKAVARKIAFKGQLVGGALSIEKFSIADVTGARIDIAGTVKGFDATPSAAVDFKIAIGNPNKLLRYLDASSPVPKEKLGKPKIAGRVTGTASAFKLAADIAGAGGTLRFDGAVNLAGAAPSINGAMAANHPELADFIRLAAPEFNPAAAKLGALKAAFHINGDPSNIRISALDMIAGPLAVKGEVALRTGGPRPAVSANLTTSEVLLDLFLPAPKAAAGTATARGRLRGSSAAGAQRKGGRWSSDPIDLSALRDFDGDVTLSMSGLIGGRIELSKPEVTAVLKAGRLEVKRFTAGLFGGAVSGNAVIDSGQAIPVLSATLSARNIDLATAAKTFGGAARIAGPLSVDASLTSTGKSQAALIAALGGQGSIGGKARVLATKQEKQAINTLGIVSALFGGKVKELQRIGGLSSVLFRAFGSTPADLSGDFTIERGIVRTGNAALSGAGARAVGVGTVDLPRWLIDMTASVFRGGDAAQTPYVSLRLTGPVDSPNIKAGGAFLSGGAGSAAKSSNPLQQLLPGVLSPKNDAPPQQTKPEDLLRGFLKRLSR